MAGDFITGVQTGANLVQTGLMASARLQELRSMAAVRQAQEEHLAAQTEALTQHMHMLIDQRADAEHAAAQYQLDTQPITTVDGTTIPPKMTEEDAVVKNFLPVASKYGGPEAASHVLANAALMPYRRTLAQAAQSRANYYDARAQERINEMSFQPGEAVDFGQGIQGVQRSPGKWQFFKGATAGGKSSAFESDVNFIEQKLGRELDPDEFQNMANVHMGLQARAARQGLSPKEKALNDEFRSVTSGIVKLQGAANIDENERQRQLGPLLRRQRELRQELGVGETLGAQPPGQVPALAPSAPAPLVRPPTTSSIVTPHFRWDERLGKTIEIKP